MTPVPVEVTLSDPADGHFTRMSETRDGATIAMTYPGKNWPYNGSPEASSCPAASQVLAAWQDALPVDQRSWGNPSAVQGFFKPRCWKDWVVAGGIGNGNGVFVFSQSGALHLVPEAEMQEFDTQVCSDPGAPSTWKSATAGPATC